MALNRLRKKRAHCIGGCGALLYSRHAKWCDDCRPYGPAANGARQRPTPTFTPEPGDLEPEQIDRLFVYHQAKQKYARALANLRGTA